MKISISENLKRLRITREVTQEALAEYIGVSAQSVSKWERGENYPDITLVPLIATFFNVTTDELLGMSALRDEKRIEDAHAKMREISDVESIVDSERQIKWRELWQELAHDMPNNDEVQLMYADFLFRSVHEQRGEEETERNRREAVKITERVLERSTDDGIRLRANDSLSRYALEFGDLDKAREYAQRLPSVTDGSRERTLVSIAQADIQSYIMERGQASGLRGYEATKALKTTDRAKAEELLAPFREGLIAYAQQTMHLLWNFRVNAMHFGLMPDDEFLRFLSFDRIFLEIINWQNPELNGILAHAYANTVSNCFMSGNLEKLLEAVEEAADYAEKIDLDKTMSGMMSGPDENGVLVNRRFERNEREFLAEWYTTATEDNEYLPHLKVHEHPRFIAAIARIRGK